MIRIGIDVGGTNTDAVLMDGSAVVATHKSATTADIGSGILSALTAVVAASGRPASEVGAVMIGTTHFTNAVVERRRLLPTAAVRVAAPATTGLPPYVVWPADLAAALGEHAYIVHGGINFDGTEIAALDEREIREVAADLRRKDIRSVAINGVFSPLDPRMERRTAELLSEELPELFVTLGSDIGQLGLLERENASLINASLRQAAQLVMRSFELSLLDAGIGAPLYISQNDGTLMSAELAERYPVLTFASGPTNSMRGAGFLAGDADAIVVDVGGTTTDVGALRNGFPREASSEVEIAGVRTNFRMPDVFSNGLGGGSVVREVGGEVQIGPDSVGYELTSKALVFGGDVLTTTDVAVAAGYAELGDRARVAHLDPAFVERAVARIHALVELAIDRAKTAAEDVPVLLVGGGTILIDRPLAGASTTRRPEHAAVANAIGAAIAQVSGEVDQVLSLDEMSREQAIARCQAEAREKAVAAGADPATIAIVEQEDVPLTYLPDRSMMRFRVRAVGDLALGEPAAAGQTSANDAGGKR